jgi:hypothetical protein
MHEGFWEEHIDLSHGSDARITAEGETAGERRRWGGVG